LFLVPGGGGNVLYFYPLGEQLGRARSCYGLQARGLDGVTPPLHDLAQIAREMVGEIKQVQPEGPYLIAGHCVGGLVAFAIAQELLAAGDGIERLLVIDAPAPHFFDATGPADLSQAQWITILVSVIAHMTGQPLSLDAQALESATKEERLIHLRDCLAEAGVVPANTPLAPIGGLLDVFIANSQLSYDDKGNSHPMPITLYRACEIDPHYDYRKYDDAGVEMSNSTLGWGRYANGEVGVHLVDGDHITMLAAANANGLATAILNSLG
jgi:thioesterase domain-containing protein